MLVVFDLDGTIANAEERVLKHSIRTSLDPDWEAFFADNHMDTAFPHALETLIALHSDGHDVRIWTARPEKLRVETVEWLLLNGIPAEVIDTLVMRQDDDERADWLVKQDWITKHGKPDLVFEDRVKVVRMWRDNGVPCYHVCDGDY